MSRVRNPASLLGDRRGLTLAEVMIASLLSIIAVFGLISLDRARLRFTDQARYAAGTKYPERVEAQTAIIRITRMLKESDRFNIINADRMQFRIPRMRGACAAGVPAPSCFDNAANYEWNQFSRLGTGAFVLYTDTAGGCGGRSVLVQKSILSGGFAVDPVNPNVVTFSLTWQNPDNAADTMAFPGEVLVRGRSMGRTDGDAGVTTGLQSPWLAMGPPAACP